MNNLELIANLAKAGFNKAEIASMISAFAPKKEEDAPAEKPDLKALIKDAVAQTLAVKDTATREARPAQPEMSRILEELTGIKAAVQTGNLQAVQMPSPETPDDILASIINPPNMNK